MAQLLQWFESTRPLENAQSAGSVELGAGFLGGLTADKYTKIASTSKPTATRDLADLVGKALLQVTARTITAALFRPLAGFNGEN